MRGQLNRTLAESITIPIALLAALYLFLAPVHWLLHPAPAGTRMAAASLVTAVAFGACVLGFRRKPPAARWAHPYALLVAGGMLTNAWLVQTTLGSSLQTTTFALILLGTASVFLRTGWWLTAAGLTWLVWFAATPFPRWGDDWTHFAFFLLSSTVFAYTVLQLRIRAQVKLASFQLHQLRAVEEERRLAELEVREKDRKLSTLISNLAGIAYRCKNDRAWTMEFLSEGTQEITGYTAEELLANKQHSYADLIHPEDRETVWKQAQAALQENRQFQLMYRIRRADGEERWLLEQGRGVHDGNGRLTALEGFISDITDRKKAELELQRSENRLRLALEASEVGIWDLDIAAWHMEWTEGMSRLFGMPDTQLSGPPNAFEPSIVPADRKEIERVAKAALKGQAPYDIEFRALPAGGGERWVAARGHVWRDDQGKAVRLMGYAQDITARKAHERQLRVAKERAEEANRLKSAIFANMSHEIRTPMTAILGYSEILMRKLKGTAMAQDAEVINTGGKRLLKLLTNVLDLARLEAGRTTLTTTGHAIEESLLRAVDLLRVLAENKGLTLSVNVPSGLMVKGDLQAEEQIWTNVLGNAIKFTDRGGIAIEVRPQGDKVVVEIRDTGIGIHPAFLPHVFDEFRQESEGLGRQYEGTGLGLSIAKRLIEALDGTIALTSEHGRGTTVSVGLPLFKANGVLAQQERAENPHGEEALQTPPQPRILVIEDDLLNIRLIERVLKDIGILTCCNTSHEGLAAAEKETFDLILLDVNLKGSALDGLEVRSRLRRIPRCAETPVLAVTAFAMEGDEERFLASGFQAYLAKPFEAGELRNLVIRTLNQTKAATAS